MKILILHDPTAVDDGGVNWLSLLLAHIGPEHQSEAILVDCSEIKSCIGCFGCWTKTPGSCVLTHDRANDISRAYMQADQVILLSQVTYGGYSADIKAFLDRSLCNLSPFFEIKNGEMHHQKRYSKYPDLLAFGYGDVSDGEQKTFKALLKRNAVNFHSPRHLAFTVRTEGEIKQAANALNAFMETR